MVRLISIALQPSRIPKCELGESCELDMRVWLTDIDLNFHVNNAKYLSLAQLGRVHYANQTGILKSMKKSGIGLVVVGAHITYHKSLALFSKYRLATRIVGWDDDWFYFEQKFEQYGKVATRVLVRMVFMESGKRMPTAKAALRLGLPNIAMKVNPEIAAKLDPVKT
ncbi:MAG: thioesterase family protein [Proteobacteria bacterium]|nr:thioesterase family protein [Pseudomonadota bacterium]MBU1389631.1 thioesterase family protein [Pseudomonadota bacterium]MBU1542569.1 thioesterase family protein [Pseudomonadota bacterium]MBU2431238.1 thioesterase family protein [Pseudomonadota bacterium]MBU2479717.1 thioesterase family protein [Pseudomonadota bacterium]